MHIQEYIRWKKSYTKPATYPHYERWVRKFLDFTHKKKDFTLEDVSQFRIYLAAYGYSPRNIQYGLYLVRDYLGYLVTMHGLQFPLKLFKIKQERSKSHYPVTTKEFEKMLTVLPKNEPIALQRRLMLSILYDTGMRVGELLSMHIKDLNPQNTFIKNEKNHRSRLVGWSEETEALLQFYLPLRVAIPTHEDWLFVSLHRKFGTQMTTRQVERVVQEIRKEAGIENVVRPHSFRHGFVHRKLEEGYPVTTVSQMLGHSSAMNVINYAQLTGIETRKAWGLK